VNLGKRKRAPSYIAARHCLFAMFLAGMAAYAVAQNSAAEQFRQSCASCHTIGGGRLVGPDLKNATQRKDRAWLVQFVQNPKAVIDSGDSYAQQLMRDSQGVVMPTLGIDAARAMALVELIEAESKLSSSQFAGTRVSERPFTAADVALGRALFTGEQPLKRGGPACISCHTLRGIGGLSGGRLGPDLTLVYERLQGRKGLGAWLTNPGSQTMLPVFKSAPLDGNEILPLLALFESTAKAGGQDDSAARLNFVLIGLGGLVIGLVGMDSIWKKRFRGVRRELVEGKRGDKQ
jgi:mono/diheme cytochrome c family protein